MMVDAHERVIVQGAVPRERVLRDLVEARAAIESNRYTYSSEFSLRDALARVLRRRWLRVETEHGISDTSGRADLFLSGLDDDRSGPSLVVEVKIQGSLMAALLQVRRYVVSSSVDGVLIASASPWAQSEETRDFNALIVEAVSRPHDASTKARRTLGAIGKPVIVAACRGSL